MLVGKLQKLFPLRHKFFNEVKLPISSGTYDKLQSAKDSLFMEVNPPIEAGDSRMESGFLIGDARDEKSENHKFESGTFNPGCFSTAGHPDTLKSWRDFNLKMPSGSFLRFLQFSKSKRTSLSRHSID